MSYHPCDSELYRCFMFWNSNWNSEDLQESDGPHESLLIPSIHHVCHVEGGLRRLSCISYLDPIRRLSGDINWPLKLEIIHESPFIWPSHGHFNLYISWFVNINCLPLKLSVYLYLFNCVWSCVWSRYDGDQSRQEASFQMYIDWKIPLPTLPTLRKGEIPQLFWHWS